MSALRILITTSVVIAVATSASQVGAQSAPSVSTARGSPLIDYNAFLKTARKVRPYRAKRLLSVADFTARAVQDDVLILDARSSQAYAAGHIEGAVNLPFTDFTADSLAAVIGKNRDRPILIYCNNNFMDNRWPVATKATPLALNNQTFINLYGYGYKNIWELGEAIKMSDIRIRWITSAG
jgi:phage shock protein E